MSDAIERLVAIVGPALAPAEVAAEKLPPSLARLLSRRNGFYAFEGALHVFADRVAPGEVGLDRWNSPDLWRGHYGDLADGHFFFAEDVFGGQFSLAPGGVFTWDAETGESDFLARDLDGWAAALLDDFEVLTGQPLAHAWQQANRPLAPGERLVPLTPFVLGGEFTVENVRALNAVTAMQVRGAVAVQLSGLPDGAQVRIRYVD